MERSESLAELTKAMVAVQEALGPVTKDKKNPFFGCMYADLGAIIEASRPLLVANGISVLQFPGPSRWTHVEPNKDGNPVNYGVVSLTTILLHASGEWIAQDSEIPCQFGDPQRGMAAWTYLRRGAMQAVVGIAAEEDDDGNAAARGAQSPQEGHSAPEQSEDGAPVCPDHKKPMKQRQNGHWYCSTPVEKDGDKVTKWCQYQPKKGPTKEEQSTLDSEPPAETDEARESLLNSVHQAMLATGKDTPAKQLLYTNRWRKVAQLPPLKKIQDIGDLTLDELTAFLDWMSE